MRFAKFRYCSAPEEIPVGSFVRHLPKRVADYYIQKVNPYQLKEMNILGTEGYEVTLPLLLTEAEENYKRAEGMINRTFDDLQEKEVEIMIAPEEGCFPSGLRRSQGRHIFAFLLPQAAAKALKAIGKDMKTAEFLLIDGGSFLTDLVLDSISGEVNHLSVYTDRAENFDDKIEEVYEETGLNLQVFSNCKNSILKEADVILNTALDLENYDYYFKKCAVYLDIVRNRQKLKRLRVKRRDMLFIDSIEIKLKDNFYKADILEATEFIRNPVLRSFLTGQYQRDEMEQYQEYLYSLEPSISNFYCAGKPVASLDIEKVKSIKEKQENT